MNINSVTDIKPQLRSVDPTTFSPIANTTTYNKSTITYSKSTITYSDPSSTGGTGPKPGILDIISQ